MEHTTRLSCIPKQLDSTYKSYNEWDVTRGYHPPWRSFPEDLDIITQDKYFRIQCQKGFQI